jgi:tetratricopeptide (TPR) repeat protein
MPRSRLWLIALAALAALAAWPLFIAGRAGNAIAASEPPPAPVSRDYLTRDAQIAFWEGAMRQGFANDMLTPRNLSSQYMQRYRERGDIGDVVRALAAAKREEAVVPHSVVADSTMVAPLLTLHRFREALSYAREAAVRLPGQSDLLTREASLEMELGDYAKVPALLGRIRREQRADINAETVLSRYEELTGHLGEARRLLHAAMIDYDAHFADASAQSRAWYHYRAGELAFEAGDNGEAIADERRAIDMFPTFGVAYTALARFELADGDARAALDAATKGADITPLPETLGYKSDAQRALGDRAGAVQTADLIAAIERIGNAYRVNDRLIAIYYAEHGVKADDALRIARREIAVRGDEIYAQDTLAWAAAMDGRWGEARSAMAKAIRYDTEDPRLQFHAGIIALHFGNSVEAKRRLSRALALNPRFHPVYADQARTVLARL